MAMEVVARLHWRLVLIGSCTRSKHNNPHEQLYILHLTYFASCAYLSTVPLGVPLIGQRYSKNKCFRAEVIIYFEFYLL